MPLFKIKLPAQTEKPESFARAGENKIIKTRTVPPVKINLYFRPFKMNRGNRHIGIKFNFETEPNPQITAKINERANMC